MLACRPQTLGTWSLYISSGPAKETSENDAAPKASQPRLVRCGCMTLAGIVPPVCHDASLLGAPDESHLEAHSAATHACPHVRQRRQHAGFSHPRGAACHETAAQGVGHLHCTADSGWSGALAGNAAQLLCAVQAHSWHQVLGRQLHQLLRYWRVATHAPAFLAVPVSGSSCAQNPTALRTSTRRALHLAAAVAERLAGLTLLVMLAQPHTQVGHQCSPCRATLQPARCPPTNQDRRAAWTACQWTRPPLGS